VTLAGVKTYAGYHRLTGPWRPTPAQQRVLDGIAAGESNPAIAQRLGLSPETVKSHVADLLAETGCADRVELARWWQAQQRIPVGGRVYPLALIAAAAALVLIGLALATLLVLAARGGMWPRSAARQHAGVVAGPLATPTTASETSPSTPGTTLTTLDQPDPASSPNGSGPVVFLWATSAGQLNHPNHLAVDGQDNLYVVDTDSSRIVKFDPNGQLLTSWGSPGRGDGQFTFRHPPAATSGIAVDAQGIVYVLDDGGRVQRFDGNGTFLGRWPGDWQRTARGQVEYVLGLVLDGQGRLYIPDCSDRTNGRVQQFSADGTLLMTWEVPCGPTTPAVDTAGNLYVAAQYEGLVRKLDAHGQLVATWGTPGTGPGELANPLDVVLDRRGNLYVVSNTNNRIDKLDSQGNVVGEWGSLGSGPGRLRYPDGIVIDAHGDIYVADQYNNRIEKFRPR
jgi:sugar lactone lactonase YvrE/DNA-binding CsgD family transcriptional regulator